MFVPLHDANSLKHIRLQWVTWAIIAINVVCYLFFNLVQSEEAFSAFALSFGYIPAVVNDYAVLPAENVIIPENLSLISYAFFHGDFMHLAGNMLFLWVFGDNVEDAMGHIKFAIFYVLCAVAAALFHGLLDLESTAPLIGASGAIAGVIGAYLLLHPKVWVWVLAFGRIPIRLPAFILLIGWIGFQIFMIFASDGDNVSWGSHIGGFLTGVILTPFLKRRGVPLLDRTLVTPDAVETVKAVATEREPDGRWGRG